MTLADLASLVGLACSACLVLGFALGWWANNATVPEDGWLPLEPWDHGPEMPLPPRQGAQEGQGVAGTEGRSSKGESFTKNTLTGFRERFASPSARAGGFALPTPTEESPP